MYTMTTVTVVMCILLTWSRGSAGDVIVSAAWLYERLSSVIVLEATYTLSEQKTTIEHIPGQSISLLSITQ